MGQGVNWQPIETAPRDGTRVICWAPDWEYPVLLAWKHNPRIERMHAEGLHQHLAQTYFGDPDGYDDYEYAEPNGGPDRWFDLPSPRTDSLMHLLQRARLAERERCAQICESMGAMDALEGEEVGSAAMVRVADRQAELCAKAIRESKPIA
jgi:hypothetical protein